MSGGHYDYIQFRIGQLADDIEGDILKQGNTKNMIKAIFGMKD